MRHLAKLRYLLAGTAPPVFNPVGMAPSEQSQALLHFLEAMPDPVLRLAPDGRVAYANATGRLFLHALQSAVGQPAPAALAALATLAAPSSGESNFPWEGRVYQFVRVRLPEAEGLFLLGREITSSQAREAGLRQELAAARELALHDPLTGLANRLLLDDRLRQALARYPRHAFRTAVAFLDLDHFKQINDRHGHQAGDQVLVAVAQRLQQQVRQTDTLARVGGDEMVLVLPEVGEAGEAKCICARLQAALQHLELEGVGLLPVGLSIGLALHPEDGATPELLLRHADQALAAAKSRGSSGVVLFQDLPRHQ